MKLSHLFYLRQCDGCSSFCHSSIAARWTSCTFIKTYIFANIVEDVIYFLPLIYFLGRSARTAPGKKCADFSCNAKLLQESKEMAKRQFVPWCDCVGVAAYVKVHLCVEKIKCWVIGTLGGTKGDTLQEHASTTCGLNQDAQRDIPECTRKRLRCVRRERAGTFADKR